MRTEALLPRGLLRCAATLGLCLAASSGLARHGGHQVTDDGWRLTRYLAEGKGSKNWDGTRRLMHGEPKVFEMLLAKIADFLNADGGMIGDEQILHRGILAAALQRDPTDLSRLRATLPTKLVVAIHQPEVQEQPTGGP